MRSDLVGQVRFVDGEELRIEALVWFVSLVLDHDGSEFLMVGFRVKRL